MFTEAKKMQMISEIIQVENEDVLNQIGALLKKNKTTVKKKKVSAQSFTGIISNKDAALMTKAIEEGCEQIDADGWN